MPKNDTNTKPKHLNGFWPLFLLVVVAMVAGAVIYGFAYGNIVQDDVNSSTFWTRYAPHVAPKKATTKKAPTTTNLKK